MCFLEGLGGNREGGEPVRENECMALGWNGGETYFTRLLLVSDEGVGGGVLLDFD